MSLGWATERHLQKYPNIDVDARSNWPFLESLLKEKFLEPIDYAIAQFLLPEAQEEVVAALICHLSSAVRAGYLCVQVTNNQLFPLPTETWPLEQEDAFLSIERRKNLEKMIQEGASILLKQPNLTSLHHENGCVYFERQWSYLQTFHREIEKFLDVHNAPVVLPVEMETKLSQEQLQAIKIGLTQQLTIIAGGPGTGKTYTAGHLLNTVWRSLTDQERSCFRIVLAAPTGKAIANLYDSIKKVAPLLCQEVDLRPTTLHSLLGVGRFKSHQKKLDDDLVIVDECSMIDLELMVKLLKSLKTGARLVLLGDPYQLPAIAPGAPFADLVTKCKAENRPQLVELSLCRRTELQSIVEVASKIKSDQLVEAVKMLKDRPIGVSLTSFTDAKSEKIEEQLLEYALPFFNSLRTLADPQEKLVQALQQFRILSPFRKGILGVENLNRLFYDKWISLYSKDELLLTPIMITQNHRALDLANGESILLVQKMKKRTTSSLGSGDYALLSDKHTGEIKRIPALLLPSYEYAFCISVHKSQGSEFDHLLFIIPPSNRPITKEMLYTGVTRAKKKLEIWAHEDALIS